MVLGALLVVMVASQSMMASDAQAAGLRIDDNGAP